MNELIGMRERMKKLSLNERIMKLTEKKKDAFFCLMFGVMAIVYLLLYVLSRDEGVGIFAIIACMMFLYADLNFGLRYPKKTKTNEENNEQQPV